MKVVAMALLVAAAALVGLPVAVDVHGLRISRSSLNKWSFPLHLASRVEHYDMISSPSSSTSISPHEQPGSIELTTRGDTEIIRRIGFSAGGCGLEHPARNGVFWLKNGARCEGVSECGT